MPQLGETVTEGTVAQWLKKVGDSVEKYEAFLEVSTDKVNTEVPSPVTGVIKQDLVKEGDTVPVGTAIAVIDEVGAATTSAPESAANPPSTPAAMASSVQEDPVPGFNIPQLEPKKGNGHARSENVIPSSYGAPGGLEPEADASRRMRCATRRRQCAGSRANITSTFVNCAAAVRTDASPPKTS